MLRQRIANLEQQLQFETALCEKQVSFLKAALEELHSGSGVPVPPAGQGCGSRIDENFMPSRPPRSVRMPFSDGEFEVGVDKDQNFWVDAATGRWEPETFKVLNQHVYSGSNYLGLGELTGVLGLVAAQRADKAVLVEPDHASVHITWDNVNRNKRLYPWAQSITVETRCVLDEDDRVMYFMGCDLGGSTVMPRVPWSTASEWYPVMCMSLPTITAEHSLSPSKPLLIKIDIEGGEAILLPSLREWVSSVEVKPTIFVSMHSQSDGWQKEAIANVLNQYPYYAIIRGPKLDTDASVIGDAVNGLCEKGVLLRRNGGSRFNWENICETCDYLVTTNATGSEALCAEEYARTGIPLPTAGKSEL
uniref:Methyltransferase FkbM domain-containing protein n=1 Tax=Hemiselmis andersenii TaxID=464988 RepID=A0A6U4Z970_HEMAN